MEKAKELVAIIIPIYQPNLSISEQISIRQTRKVFSSYPTYFICPSGIETDEAYEDIKKVYFDRKWFNNTRSYSALMLQPFLYEKFSGYEYILICQLDVFIFEDRLEEFCSLGYDYIGAPWLHGIAHFVNAAHMLHYVGNGGLSLRRVSAFREWLAKADLSDQVDFINEDIIIAAYGQGHLRIPGEKTALGFAFDMDPRECFRRNSHRLPMGCHAWARIDMEFWRPYIEAEGYDTSGINGSANLRHYETRYLADEKQKILLQKLGERKVIVRLLDGLIKKRRFYIWGIGVWGGFVGKVFTEYGIKTEAFIDRRKEVGEFLDIHVLHSLDNIIGSACFFIAVEDNGEIEKQLKEKGYVHYTDYLLLEDILDGRI